jgi:hypothetical protein
VSPCQRDLPGALERAAMRECIQPVRGELPGGMRRPLKQAHHRNSAAPPGGGVSSLQRARAAKGKITRRLVWTSGSAASCSHHIRYLQPTAYHAGPRVREIAAIGCGGSRLRVPVVLVRVQHPLESTLSRLAPAGYPSPVPSTSGSHNRFYVACAPQVSGLGSPCPQATLLVRPLLKTIGGRDRDLASQLRRAMSSVSLNTAEAFGSQVGSARLRFESARGSVCEVVRRRCMGLPPSGGHRPGH